MMVGPTAKVVVKVVALVRVTTLPAGGTAAGAVMVAYKAATG